MLVLVDQLLHNILIYLSLCVLNLQLFKLPFVLFRGFPGAVLGGFLTAALHSRSASFRMGSQYPRKLNNTDHSLILLRSVAVAIHTLEQIIRHL